MSYLSVGGSTTDVGGNYFTTGSASFSGRYVTVVDGCGVANMDGSDGIDWGTSGGTNCKLFNRRC